MTSQQRGALRHLLTALGPLAAAHGFMTEAYWQILIGVLFAGWAFYDSWTAPEKKKNGGAT